jgi:GxxExxY protein
VTELLHKELTQEIIGAAFEVHNHLGYGFLEKVYQQAVKLELELRGLTAEDESEINVTYKGRQVGFYKADLFMDKCVIVELKTAKEYQSADEAQLLNELKGTGMKVGLLINFGRTKVDFKRFVF